MPTVPAKEIKRRGISAVDDYIAGGAVHISVRNRSRYVVLDAEHYAELIESTREGVLARIRESEENIAAGNVTRYHDVASLMAAIDASPDEDE